MARRRWYKVAGTFVPLKFLSPNGNEATVDYSHMHINTVSAIQGVPFTVCRFTIILCFNCGSSIYIEMNCLGYKTKYIFYNVTFISSGLVSSTKGWFSK